VAADFYPPRDRTNRAAFPLSEVLVSCFESFWFPLRCAALVAWIQTLCSYPMLIIDSKNDNDHERRADR